MYICRIKLKQTVMKGIKVEIPADCDVDKIETQDGHIVVTFKEKERKLPKSWEEFCEMFPVEKKEFYIDDCSRVLDRTDCEDERRRNNDKNLLPDRATAEAVLALCQLIRIRNAYNQGWLPDWSDDKQPKYIISFARGMIDSGVVFEISYSPLYFKTKELRDEFLRCFRDLIEKLKPLYGIKGGGEE